MTGKKMRTAPALALIAACGGPAAAQSLVWTRQFGTPTDDRGGGVAVDGAGDIYLTAMTYGSLGGPSAGGQDAYVAKFDDSGALQWTRQLGTPTDDAGRRVAVDGTGGVYIAGRTRGSLGGPSAGGRDTFLAKYDTSGELQWMRQIGSFADEHLTPSVAVDGAGDVYIANSTLGSVGGPSAGNSDGFVAKYDASGALRWTRQFGTSAWDNTHAIAVDAAGGVYIVGQTEGSLGGPIAGSWDAFLLKFDASGTRVWARQFGTSVIDGAGDVAVDTVGSVYVLGNTGGSLGGPSAGSRDAFLAKFDASGALQWMQQFGTSEWDSASTVALDGAGGVYITGHTEGSLGGPSAGNNDAFLMKFDASGTLQWMRQIGTSGLDYASGVAVGGGGGVYMFGETQGSLGGPRLGGVWDAFLAKFEAAGCSADCDRSGDLTFFDFLCFQNLFAAMDPTADCDGSGELTFFDFLCFQNEFVAGCP
jgi:hypothetical protein